MRLCQEVVLPGPRWSGAMLGIGLFFFGMADWTRSAEADPVRLIPRPVAVRIVGGEAARLDSSSVIRTQGKAVVEGDPARRVAEVLRHVTGLALGSGPVTGKATPILVRISGDLFPDRPDWQRAEGYRLSVSSAQVELVACKPHGLFNGAQTLAQLLKPNEPGRWQAPACVIEDYPRFPWRGLLIDPARHFVPPEFVKKLLDVMALYKFNTLQIHLTDDQGWRIEIKKYPRLTQVGSVRKESPLKGNRNQGDGTPYGPFFYTQREIRELVAYAQARRINIVPEIEMPGHFLAALAAYPEFSCRGGPFEVRTRWGVEPDILCPGRDQSLAFVTDVLSEIVDLFPSRFIHIGGDEAPRDRWKACPQCQARIRSEGLKNEAELQSWFNHRLEAFLASKGRRLVGWDEILDGGLAPGAVVMSWRGMQGGLAAAEAGHDVVMSPTSHCYLDYAQARGTAEPESIGGFIPLSKVYLFEPVPPTLSESRRRHILGGQGNIWSEYLWRPEDVEYFAFPRALALAEVLWSPAEHRSFEDFLVRLERQLPILERLRVNYRRLDPAGQ